MAQITRIGNPLSDSRRYQQTLPCHYRENAKPWYSQWWALVTILVLVACSWNAFTNRQKVDVFESGDSLEKELEDISNTLPSIPTQYVAESASEPIQQQQDEAATRASANSNDSASSSSSTTTTTMIHTTNVGVSGASVQTALEKSTVKPAKVYNRRDWNSVLTKKCFQQGLPDEKRPNNAVDNKLPTAIVLGEGSETLYHYLNQHNDLASMALEQNFLDAKVDAWILKSRSGIPRKDSRAAYAKSVSNSLLDPNDSLSSSSDGGNQKIVLDWTQNYLFHSDKVPARVSCIVPWAKIIGILQNPIDRALAQYEATEFENVPEEEKPISFEDYILADISALMETGVLQDWTRVSFDEFAGSPQEQRAWRTYTMSGVPGPVGRGLYSIMIQQYLTGLPSNDFLFMPAEDWRENAQESYRVVLDFLGLTAKVRSNMWDAGEVTSPDRRTQFLGDDVKYVLEHLYEPYNRRLETLLGKQWEGIWKEE